jgi:hypothetical protein
VHLILGYLTNATLILERIRIHTRVLCLLKARAIIALTLVFLNVRAIKVEECADLGARIA